MPEYIARDPRTPEESSLGDALLEALETVLEMPRDLKVPTDPLAAILRDVVVAAGWRPPARVITDLAELDTLPVGSVVMDSPYPEGDVCRRTADGVWEHPGLPGCCTSRVLSLPVVVLWTPPQEGQAEDAQIREGDRG
ncbi:hypothetical protein [Nocardia farcinica]|uniref:Uncharacterized protein n=1 Tax=Nocardia farcinica (strain IFM 10152) TaxID=247156 RepID=Q5YSK0_NOCFA|nr:hypothetical protein [Nocardia farcinica]BAD58841.1 hypothetical protein NFA_39930 [Nocardia farcinica IFM 10152]